MSDQSDVCALIVTYNIGKGIRQCAESVRPQVHRIVIVDNGSDQETLDELRKLEMEGEAKIIYNPKNLGIARALNQGVHYAMDSGFQWILTLDHDSEATPGMVEKLLRAYQTVGGGAGIVAAYPFDRNANVFIHGEFLRHHDGNIVEVRGALSSGSLFNVDVFRKLGLFNESLFVYYVDTEFCLRLWKSGLKVYMCEDAVLVHSEGSKEIRWFFGRRVFYDRYGKEARYYLTRNTIYMLRRYYSDARFSYGVIRRLLTDHAKLVLYDEDRLSKTLFSVRGAFDALRGKYGGLSPPKAEVR